MYLRPINPGICRGDLNWGIQGNDGVGRGSDEPARALAGDGGEKGFGDEDVIGNPRGNLGERSCPCFGDMLDLDARWCSWSCHDYKLQSTYDDLKTLLWYDDLIIVVLM